MLQGEDKKHRDQNGRIKAVFITEDIVFCIEKSLRNKQNEIFKKLIKPLLESE